MSVTKKFVEGGYKGFTPDLRLCASNHTSKGEGLAEVPGALLRVVQQPSRDHHWSGKAEQAAEGRADHIGREANSMSADFTKVGVALLSFADTVEHCCEKIQGAIGAVHDFDQVVPMEVSEDLKVTDPHFDLAIAHAAFPERMRQQRIEALAKGQGAIDAFTRQMQDAAGHAAQVIKESFAHAVEAVPASEALGKKGNIVAKAIADGTLALPSDPRVLHDLWANLSPEDKDAIYARYPDIGNHGGIPFDPPDHRGRDYYNRLELPKIKGQKEEELHQWEQQHPDWAKGHIPDGSMSAYKEWETWKEHHNALLHEVDGYKKVEQASKPGQSPPRFLGYVDDKGRAAVSINNPDKAKKNATLVPGTGVDLTRMDAYDQRSYTLYNRVHAQDKSLGTDDVSVTSWMGYDRPMDVGAAGSDSSARNGAQALVDFQAGVRASHEGAPSQNTVIGHSYGSTEVGAAATGGHHLDADVVISIGSPGMLADNAGQLNLNPGAKVFVAIAQNDILNVPASANWNGHNPADWGDAFQFDTDPGPPAPWYEGGAEGINAHSSYFVDGSAGMNNMGRIIAGEDGTSGVTHR